MRRVQGDTVHHSGHRSPPPRPATLSSLTINPSSVIGGTPATGTVTLPAPAPAAGLVVTLGRQLLIFASNDPTSLNAPLGITVAPGVPGTGQVVTGRSGVNIVSKVPVGTSARAGAVTLSATRWA